MANQSLIAKLDVALNAPPPEASFTAHCRGLGSRRWHHGHAKLSSLCSFLQDDGKARDTPWTIKRSPQLARLAACEVHTKSSKKATAFMFTQGQQQPTMGQYPQQATGQPQQPMMGTQQQQPLMAPQQPTMNQQQPMMNQQPPNYQQPMMGQQQQPPGQNYSGQGGQGNNGFGNNGGGYNNNNNGGGNSNMNSGGGDNGNSGSNNNANNSSGGSSSKKGSGGALAAGILLPVVLAALGGFVTYMVFCRSGNAVPVPPNSDTTDIDTDSDPASPSSDGS